MYRYNTGGLPAALHAPHQNNGNELAIRSPYSPIDTDKGAERPLPVFVRSSEKQTIP